MPGRHRDGADAVIAARRLDAVRLLAAEDIPVMGHLGFVPKKSTLYGGVRAVGRTAAEATALWQQFQQLEDAGAFAVECELIPAEVMAEIHRRTGMATISLGSGPAADVMFLFSSDVCGESPRLPRHARACRPRVAAPADRRRTDPRVTEFPRRRRVGGFPSDAEVARIDAAELEGFRQGLDKP
jgi:3-methyl-2-oxobutanoate hydroxymethyltransferase